MKHSNKGSRGFTLAELLIVVAIIAVLTAVAIPVFASQLEKSREATDTASIRGQYAEVMARANATGGNVNVDGSEFGKVQLRQRNEYWQNNGMENSLESLGAFDGYPAPGGVAWVSYSAEGTSNVVIHFSGGAGGGTPTQTDTPTQQDQTPHQQNVGTATTIQNTVENMLKTAQGVENGSHVEIVVHADGTFEIDTKKTGDNVTAAAITAQLVAAGVCSDGKITFAENDEEFPNGYDMKFTFHNGEVTRNYFKAN